MEISCNLMFEGFQSMANFRDETSASQLKQVLIVTPRYIYIYVCVCVCVCVALVLWKFVLRRFTMMKILKKESQKYKENYKNFKNTQQ
jgi:hypothetical protein